LSQSLLANGILTLMVSLHPRRQLTAPTLSCLLQNLINTDVKAIPRVSRYILWNACMYAPVGFSTPRSRAIGVSWRSELEA